MKSVPESVRTAIRPVVEFSATVGLVLLMMFAVIEFYRFALPLYFAIAKWSVMTCLSMFF